MGGLRAAARRHAGVKSPVGLAALHEARGTRRRGLEGDTPRSQLNDVLRRRLLACGMVRRRNMGRRGLLLYSARGRRLLTFEQLLDRRCGRPGCAVRRLATGIGDATAGREQQPDRFGPGPLRAEHRHRRPSPLRSAG